MKKISQDIDKYLNIQNQSLWDELNADYEIDLFYDQSEYSWVVIIDDNKAKIITPDLNISYPSFTHELLHIKLDKLGMTNFDELTDFANDSPIFSNFIFRKLIFATHNFHSHKKMYPYFNQMGFEDEDFVGVREKFSFMDSLQLRIFPKIKLLRSFGIECFLGKFFALKNDFVQREKRSTEKKLKRLYRIDKKLYHIAEEFDAEWDARTDFNYISSLEQFELNLKPYLVNKYGR